MSDTGLMRGPERGALAMRLVHLILIGLMIGAAVAVLHLMTLVQFVVMLVDRGTPNAQIADFGRSLGLWIARAARFQSAESQEKPWPWRPLD